MSNSTVNAVPDAETLVEKARQMIPWLREVGPQHDTDKRVSDDVACKLRENGFFRICQSRENGGYGLRPSVLWKVTREVARGDSATAWILSLAGLHPWVAGMFPPQAQDEVFENGSDAVVIALTGNVGRGVTADYHGTHFTLNGKWTYASGIDVADWAAVLVDAEVEGNKRRCLLLVPKSSFEIDHGSWNVLGLRGTGSKDVYLKDEQVPVHRCIFWDDLQRLEFPGSERNQDPMYRIPHTSLFAMSVAAAVAAVGHGMLDLYCEALQRRVPVGIGQAQIEDRFSMAELGKAASRLDMAYNQLMHDVDEMYDRAAAGYAFTITDRARYRANAAVLAETVMESVDIMVRSIGGSLLPNGPIERCFRDIHSMASHFLQTNHAAELLGRSLMGLSLPPNARI